MLCVIDIYSNYASVVPLENKKCTTISNAFQKILDESNHKQYKIWLYKGSEFYNRSMTSWLQDDDIEMHSKLNNDKTVINKRFLRNLKKKN